MIITYYKLNLTMRNKFKFWSFLTSLLIICLSAYETSGQVSVADHVDLIPELKSGTTYIVMKYPESSVAKEYVEIFKKYWTISNIEFIKTEDIKQYYLPGNFFFSIAYFPGGMNTVNSIDFELWNCKDKYLKSKMKNPVEQYDRNLIATFCVFKNLNNYELRDSIFLFDYDFGGHFFNWGPGLLKNYLQQLMLLLNTPKLTIYRSNMEVSGNKEIKELKTHTLYVPYYVLLMVTAKNYLKKRENEDEVFKGYKYKYEFITTEKLNNKILNDEFPFYYANIVREGWSYFFSITNSVTGEVIYSTYDPYSNSGFGQKDIDALGKAIINPYSKK